nr:MAG TPA: hypothetical protein [Caudoviricetes sp.]
MTEKKYTKEQLRQQMCEQLNFISEIADSMQDSLERGDNMGVVLGIEELQARIESVEKKFEQYEDAEE